MTFGQPLCIDRVVWESRPPEQTCCICAELRDGRMPLEIEKAYGRQARICVETNEYVALPSVSPLSGGHMLIFPKEHVSALCRLGSDSRSALLQLVPDIAFTICDTGTAPLFFEHGVADDSLGACGITHAHLHIVPLAPHVIEKVCRRAARRFPPTTRGTLEDVYEKATAPSYLLLGKQLHDMQLSVADSIPSQFIRRLIATELGRQQWDWRLLSRRQCFVETLRMFDNARLAAA
jgi:diadenosine tetraphosphate (Ap4A) HIT family hydrolase